MSTDRIEKTVLLKAPREKVWGAISDSRKFGAWFGAEVEGAFAPGATLKCRIRPTTVDPEIASAQERWAGVPFDLHVERVEPMRLFSYRWQPGADPTPAFDTTTLVTFELEDAPGGILLRITESGFDQIPLEHRARVYQDNAGGWTAQCGLIRKYLEAQGA